MRMAELQYELFESSPDEPAHTCVIIALEEFKRDLEITQAKCNECGRDFTHGAQHARRRWVKVTPLISGKTSVSFSTRTYTSDMRVDLAITYFFKNGQVWDDDDSWFGPKLIPVETIFAEIGDFSDVV